MMHEWISLSIRPFIGCAPSQAGTTQASRRLSSLLSVHSVVGKMFMLQVAITLLLATGAVILLVLTERREIIRDAADRSLAVSEGFAHFPGIVEALKSPNPTAVLQPLAMAAMKGAKVNGVVVANRDGIR